jgi:hypothetical protein
MCEAIDRSVKEKHATSIFDNLYGAANIYYNYSGTTKCFDLKDNSDPHDLGGWQWQVHTTYPSPPIYSNSILHKSFFSIFIFLKTFKVMYFCVVKLSYKLANS